MKGLKIVKSRERGITLIALVVTIIVLIILATVSISMVTGENGLIKKAEQARKVYENSVRREDASMNELLKEIAETDVPDNPPEVPTPIQVKLEVDEARVTGTTIPVTAKVTTIDGDKEVTEGITYEFYQNNEKDGGSSKISAHTFDDLEEKTEYTLKVIAKDVRGQTVEDSLIVGAFNIGTSIFRYTLGMTWGDFLDSEYSKSLGEDGTYLKRITKTLRYSQYELAREYEMVGNSNDIPLTAMLHSYQIGFTFPYVAVLSCPCGRLVDVFLYPSIDSNEYTPLETYMRTYRDTEAYHKRNHA